MNKEVRSLEELEAVVQEIAATLSAKETRATLLTLSGDLGTGKTTFTQMLARAFGIRETLTSPTFVLAKTYSIAPTVRGFSRLVHMDAYRLTKSEELSGIGFTDYLQDPETLIVLEWPERVADVLIPDYTIHLSAHPDGTRTLTYGTHR